MIRAGDRLENPVTGEVLVFHETADQTGGELVRVETIVQPDGFVAAAHVHPAQTERFEVSDGTVGFRLRRRTLLAGPGDVAVVPAGTPHRFWNEGPGEARFVCEIVPGRTPAPMIAAGRTPGPSADETSRVSRALYRVSSESRRRRTSLRSTGSTRRKRCAI
jgi:quercetin dioxygenase-like cupin family protein